MPMRNIKLGSLFDGIGVFPLAASRCHIVPVWASEIEKVPMSITKRHFPNMEHLGDITKIKGGEITPVHIITFGSPCQNLSLAGCREGLSGSKSSLFFEAIRIIREMRGNTNGMYPTFAVWENVYGAFSSNHRMDFKSVLESFAGSEIPMPASGRWASAGMVRGRETDISWRLMDARYWGKPPLLQRRRRIFLVADFRGERSGEILFKPRSMLPYPASCRKDRSSSARTHQSNLIKARGKIPIVHPIQERRMRGAAKERDRGNFLGSFGRPDDPFPTLLAGGINYFAFWYEGDEENGFIRYLTPTECERLQGLPEDWTKFGAMGEEVGTGARCKALGNSIALPCAEHIMQGIYEVLKGGEKPCRKK